MNTFKNIVADYNLLIATEFEFEIESGKTINLKMYKENLPHLLGLQYLSDFNADIREFNDNLNPSNNAKTIMDTLVSKNIQFQSFYMNPLISSTVKNRIEFFSYVNIMRILKGVTAFNFIFDPTRSISKKAKLVFIEKKKNMFMQLYLGYDIKNKYYYPLSFIPNENQELSIERTPIKIAKTTIFYNKGFVDEHKEVLEHKKMRPIIKNITENIKKYNKLNEQLYKKISSINKAEDNTDKIIIEINELFFSIKKCYLDLESLINIKDFLSRNNNRDINNFFEYCKHKF